MKKAVEVGIDFDLPEGLTPDMTLQEVFEYSLKKSVSSSTLRSRKKCEVYFKFESGDSLEINYERSDK